VERLRNTLRTLSAAIDAPGDGTDQELATALIDGQQRFLAALDDDFNTPEAWAALDGVARAINQSVDSPSRPSANQLREAKRALLDLLDVFALANIDADDAVPAEVSRMVNDREAARVARDFAEADRLRDAVRALGYEIRDSADGPQAVPIA
jgi:cysteinyl-tRNA synthetase